MKEIEDSFEQEDDKAEEILNNTLSYKEAMTILAANDEDKDENLGKQMEAVIKLLPFLKDISEVNEDDKGTQQKLAGYIINILNNVVSASEKEKLNYVEMEWYSNLMYKIKTIPRNTVFHQEILHRMLMGFADDTYKYVMDHQQNYLIDEWKEKAPGEIAYYGFPEISKKHLKTYAQYEDLFNLVTVSEEHRDELYSAQQLPKCPDKPVMSDDVEKDKQDMEDYNTLFSQYDTALRSKGDEVYNDVKLFTAMTYAKAGIPARDEIMVEKLKKIGQGRLLEPYSRSMSYVASYYRKAPKFEKTEVNDMLYAELLENLSARLQRTDEGLFYSVSYDSDEFTNLLNKCSKLVKRKEKAERNGEKLRYTREEFKELYSCVDDYFEHCEDNERGDSRRQERMKIAQRIKWICQAYSYGANPEEYLKDIIAEDYYGGILERSKLDKKEKEAAHLYDANHKRKVIDGYIKKSAGFQSMMARVKNITDLYHLCENKTKTFDKMLSINSKEDTKQNQTFRNEPKIKKNEKFVKTNM